MKIEAGKWYKMRNGERAYIIGIKPEGMQNDYNLVGVYEDRNTHHLSSWLLKGTSSCYRSLDIISLWEEPTKPVELPEKLSRESFSQYKIKVDGLDIIEAVNPLEKAINAIFDYLAYQQTQIEELQCQE